VQTGTTATTRWYFLLHEREVKGLERSVSCA
jgi:hypothetical protein